MTYGVAENSGCPEGMVDATRYMDLREKIRSRLSAMESLLSITHQERHTPKRALRFMELMEDVLLDELHDHIVALREHYVRQAEKAGQR